MAHCRTFSRNESGATIVEFTLIFPILLLLTFTIIDLGLMFWQWNSAERATQIGVRTAVTNGSVFTAWDSSCGQVQLQGATAGTFCSAVPGSDSWSVSCVGTNLAAPGCDSAAFAVVVAQMQTVFPNIATVNVIVEYSGAGLGFVGRATPVPVVSVSLQNMQYDLVFLDALLGWFNTVAIPASRATLTGEDLNTAGAG